MNRSPFVKFIRLFHRQSFALYGTRGIPVAIKFLVFMVIKIIISVSFLLTLIGSLQILPVFNIMDMGLSSY